MSASSSHNHGDPGGPPIPFHPHSANTQHNTQPSREPPHSHYDFSTILQSRPDSQTQSRPASQTQSPYPTNDSYFNEAFHSTPSPPPTSFLDNILNPVESHTVSFGYRFRDSPPRQRRQSPVVYIQPGDMPTTQRSARLADGFVDLTSLDDSPNDPHTSRRLKRRSPSSGPSTKRVKQNDGTSLKAEDRPEEVTVEEIDLSDDKQTVQDVLQKQREEAVKAQQKPEEKATTFNSFTCVICMDTPTDLTATACGMSSCLILYLNILTYTRSSFLSYLPYGSPHRWRESRCAW